jgi:hypothetical protein
MMRAKPNHSLRMIPYESWHTEGLVGDSEVIQKRSCEISVEWPKS